MSNKRSAYKYQSNRSRKTGMPPGSLVYIGKKKHGLGAPRITVIEYSETYFEERHVSSLDEVLPLKPSPCVTWINVDAVQNEALLGDFGKTFNLHPLLLEDILNTEQRPKCEHLEDTIYVILKMFDFNAAQQDVVTEQVSLVIGANFLLTFQEEVGDEFDAIRERLRANSQRLRKGGTDYLAYSLLDAVVDRYFVVLEKIGECLQDLDEKLSDDHPPDILSRVHHLKRELIFLRKHIWPVRDVVNSLQHSDSVILSDQTKMYLRDVYDHTIQAMDTLETYRDLLSGIQELYLSILSNRMNEIMKVLTIISTIFIPLTFLVGVYGMNFHYMPELAIPWAYPALWCVMILMAAGMIIFFRRKRWF
jgi:magnesium transporter